MPRNGSGNFSYADGNFASNTVISSTVMNTKLTDVATALSASIANDGQTTITANLPMSGFKHTGVANASARTDYAAAGQVQDGSFTWCGTAGGTKNALTLTPSPSITAYAAGQKFRFTSGATQSDDAVTVAISGLSTKAIQNDGSALSASVYIEASKLYEITYDGTAFQLSKVVLGATAAQGALAATSVQQGKHTIWVPAGAMTARTTNGAGASTSETTTNKVMLKSLDFDQTTVEYAQFSVAFPKSWNESTVTAQVFWTAASGTGDVVWGVQGVAISNDDVLDAAFGTAQTVTDTVIATTDLHVTSETSAITVAGTPADADECFFQVYRDAGAGGDTLNADAKLLGVKLYYTINAATDA